MTDTFNRDDLDREIVESAADEAAEVEETEEQETEDEVEVDTTGLTEVEAAAARAEAARQRSSSAGRTARTAPTRAEATAGTDEQDVPLVGSTRMPPMPDLTDPDIEFDNDKYRARMAEWNRLNTRNAVAQEINQRRIIENVETRVAAFKKTHKDFDSVVTNNAVLKANQLAQEASLAVARSPYAADILYHFGKNNAEAARVAALSPAEQLVAIGKVEERIRSAKRSASTASTAQGGQRQGGGQRPAARPLTREEQLSGKESTADFARRHRNNLKKNRPGYFK